MPDAVKRINLWSGPRNVSTALLYSFAQRSDTRVVDEPLYAHYLRVSGARHPGAGDVLAAQDNNGKRVVRDLLLGPCDRPVLFLKQMAHHLVDLDLEFMRQAVNVILIRDPAQMLPSLTNQVPQPTLADTGLARQCELLEIFEGWGHNPPVIDSRELLLNPRSVLEQLCAELPLEFQSGMLAWPAGPKPYDGVWAPHWYQNVHRSTTFAPYKAKREPFPSALKSLLAECSPFYERLLERAIHG
jgi:hypothetical protein